MSPAEIRQLRQALQCTARELAATLELEAGEVAAWEQGERFPTKTFVLQLEKLRTLGPAAIVRKKRRKATALLGMARLADPAFWLVVRKLVEHSELFDQVQSLAEAYPDPSTSSDAKT